MFNGQTIVLQAGSVTRRYLDRNNGVPTMETETGQHELAFLQAPGFSRESLTITPLFGFALFYP
jgi:hypothetical protein